MEETVLATIGLLVVGSLFFVGLFISAFIEYFAQNSINKAKQRMKKKTKHAKYRYKKKVGEKNYYIFFDDYNGYEYVIDENGRIFFRRETWSKEEFEKSNSFFWS